MRFDPKTRIILSRVTSSGSHRVQYHPDQPLLNSARLSQPRRF